MFSYAVSNGLQSLITKDVHSIIKLLNVNHFHFTENICRYLHVYGLPVSELCERLPQTENSKVHDRLILLYVQHR